MKKLIYQRGNAGVMVVAIIIIVGVLILIFTGNKGEESDMPHNDDTMMEEQPTNNTTDVSQFTLTIENVSQDQPLSPGVYAVHTDQASFDFAGEIAPAAMEPLAEYGANSDFADLVRTLPGVARTYPIGAPVLPGEDFSFVIDVPNDGQVYYLSGIQMAVASNDGYAVVNNIPLNGSNSQDAANYDNGTEENEALGSGFDGGQPEPARGQENVENGTPTDPVQPVGTHPQLTETLMRVSVEPVQ